jgi:hypothetical protein
MHDVFAVAELLVSHAVERYGDEIDLIGCYGSQGRGDAREDSDLDIFYTPGEGKNPPIARTFLIEERLYDFWPIRWETLEGFATGRVHRWAEAPGLVQGVKVLHARSPEQIERLARLKQLTLDLLKPEARPEMIGRALGMFGKVTADLGNLRLAVVDGNPADVRFSGWQVIMSACECLSLANQVYFDKGLFRKSLKELDQLRDRPADMERLIDTVATSPDHADVLDAAEQLAQGTRQILRGLQTSLPAGGTVRDSFCQVYPEMKDMIWELLSACERGDRVGASIGAMNLQYEVTSMLSETGSGAGHEEFNLYSEYASAYREAGFPDLMRLAPDPLDELARQTRLFDKQFRQWLRDHSVDLCEYESVEQFRQSL